MVVPIFSISKYFSHLGGFFRVIRGKKVSKTTYLLEMSAECRNAEFAHV